VDAVVSAEETSEAAAVEALVVSAVVAGALAEAEAHVVFKAPL